jgi:hypothetical protein
MSKNHFTDSKNLENHTSQHDAVKTVGSVKMLLACFFLRMFYWRKLDSIYIEHLE